MERTNRMILMLLALACVACAAAGEVTTVALRSTVRLAPGEALTLGAVAAIEGRQRDLLAGLPVPGAVEQGAWTVVEADAIRAMVERSAARVGSVVVKGSRASVTRVPERTERPAPAQEPAPDTPNLRRHLESWLTGRHAPGADEVRVTFDERDAALLATPTAGRVVEVRQIGSSSSLSLRVTVYERDTIVLSDTLRVGLSARMPAPVAVRPLRRGVRVDADAFEVRLVWADPSDPPADPATVAGRVLRRALGAGEAVHAGHLETPVLVERGQDVSVRSVRGSVVVTTIARARHDACEGDLVELEPKDRSGRRFTARVAGPGRAVMIDPTEVTP